MLGPAKSRRLNDPVHHFQSMLSCCHYQSRPCLAKCPSLAELANLAKHGTSARHRAGCAPPGPWPEYTCSDQHQERAAGEQTRRLPGDSIMSVAFTEEDVREGLKNVYDPEIGVNIVDLGLVYDVDVDQDKGDVLVTMTLTSLGCPLGPVIVQEVTGALKDLPGISDVDVKLVWSPPWSPDLMSEEAKDELGIW
jgi:metal-sulfur cluster biosynthetic enzyme